ncbi:DNA cytosine methyltransferase [bacterium]|nr:DNA cytosine methyltransferase [bacterium]
MPQIDSRIPIIDLFAGPGGLGEGFSRFPKEKKMKAFRIAVSIEKDPYAHKTLTLRSFFRQFPEGEAPEKYYEYLRGESTQKELFDAYPKQAKSAQNEAQLRTLGAPPAEGEEEITKVIGDKIKGHDKWILIGGPPCQAYSLAGRSRMLGLVQQKGESSSAFSKRKRKNAEKFEGDHRHMLYREYLKIIADHSPPVFVMENVKGILSARLNGKLIFPQILEDLGNPQKALGKRKTGPRYRIHSLVKRDEGLFSIHLEPKDYLIRAENYGIPQNRHRVILVGVREDIDDSRFGLLKQQPGASVESIIGNLPKLSPGLSRGRREKAYDALLSITQHPDWKKFLRNQDYIEVADCMVKELARARKTSNRGSSFESTRHSPPSRWYADARLGGVPNHETRSHIPEDLWRYFYCACFAKAHKVSPTLKDFPQFLLPNHKNVDAAISGQKFGDRFRVQCYKKPSTTITSHISKDGHYFIHPDPSQFRSLTVREAARLQTFPDNYYFEGPRTQQFHQVGNAVPPSLAEQIAGIVNDLIHFPRAR